MLQLYRDSCIVSVVERWCVADRRRLEELAGDSENEEASMALQRAEVRLLAADVA